ncbi:MAG TPA: alkaline phosphatase family protein [Nocardioidaceae bacterium]|nr:alkaline phosphatase family protein [Nocardioidaceae bacterium]
MTPELDRRSFLRVGAAAGATYLFSSSPAAPAASAARSRKRVYVLVVDGCRPDEIGSGLMPRLQALRDGGTNFPRARSLPIMETIPNHVMMMTGVRPDRSGVPANVIYDRREQVIRDMDRPADLHYPTVIERLNRDGLTTGTVLSKEYLFGIFGKRATHRWEPGPIVIPVSGHAPDQSTMDAALAMVEEFDPNLVFVNLGDCDRAGHSDVTGPTAQAVRRAALVSSDTQVGRFVDMLTSTGRWRNSVMVVLADHSMDWSLPNRLISLQPAFDADGLLAGKVQIAQNGGADLLYWIGRDNRRRAAVDRMRTIARATPGVLSTHSGADLKLGARAGDLIAYCKSGWRFSDPAPLSNPIPGNHGHPATRPIPFFLAGGSRLVGSGVSSPRLAHTIDVAPTVGKIFGLGEPRGGYDGRVRI